MPSGRVNQTLYIGASSNIEALNATTLYKPGELGSHIELSGKGYQLVQLDSGATSSTSAGTPVAGHLAYWKSRTAYLVTNDKAQCENPGTTASGASVAGVFVPTTSGGAAGSTAATAGNYCVIQNRGTHIGIYTPGVTAAAGDQLFANTAVSTAGVQKITPGTTYTGGPVVAVATGATGAVTANYTPCRIGGADLVDVP